MQINTSKIIYKREKLMQTLGTIWEYPLTVIEAPMGYGKTTAVKEFLGGSDAQVHWFTLMDSSVSAFWRGFCRMIRPVDANCSARLEEWGLPGDDVFMDKAIELLEKIDFAENTCFVVDDYHLLTAPLMDEFIERLIKSSLAGLHVIVISRSMFGENTTELALKGFCQVIGKSSFEFSCSEIIAYYKICGVSLTENETDKLYAYTEGWISALYLSLLNLAQEQKIDLQSSLSELIEKTVYRPYPQTVKDFLLTLCIFDSFSLKQAEAVWPKAPAKPLIQYLMKHNAFIRYDHYNQTYHIHNILGLYLREQLAQQGEARWRELQELAAQWYMQNEEYISAMECFYQARNFDKLLTAFEKDNGHNTIPERKGRILQYFSECPAEIRRQHPIAALIYARKLFLLNETELYPIECKKVGEDIQEIVDEKMKKHFLGELELIKSFSRYNDLQGMVDHQTRAYELLQGPSCFFDHRNFFTFGTPSVLYMFYRQSGAAQQTADLLTKFMPRYCRITENHGAGAEYVMQAEVYFYRGDFENAAITIHKAEQPARSSRQISILLCVLFLRARLAIVAQNLAAVQEILQQMRAEIEQHAQYQAFYAFDICEGFLYAQLNQLDKIPAWIVKGRLQESPLYFLSHAFFNMIYAKALLLKRDYIKLLGVADQFLAIAGVFPNLLSSIYLYIYIAIACKHLQRLQEAEKMVRQAMTLAEPDAFIMPFAEHYQELYPLLFAIAREREYSDFLAAVKVLQVQLEADLHVAQQDVVIDARAQLTTREREIAELVAQGLSNKAIAQQLFIEETTVKKTLQNIYAKLELSGRTMLTRWILKNEG